MFFPLFPIHRTQTTFKTPGLVQTALRLHSRSGEPHAVAGVAWAEAHGRGEQPNPQGTRFLREGVKSRWRNGVPGSILLA